MKLYATIMIRNEIDIASDFFAYHLEIFDKIIVADMQSSDGTAEVIQHFAETTGKIECYKFPYLAKYQSEILTRLSKRGFEQDADWMFFLDADEFLKVESRAELESYLETFGGEVMHLPWINLVPSRFGEFSKFDLSQDFYWSGRLSQHVKVAISGQYVISYPNYKLEAGNHNIMPFPQAEPEVQRNGIPLLHVPVRSVERMKYKSSNALDLQVRKHNQMPGEGFHHKTNLDVLDGEQVDAELLSGLAQDYGSKDPIKPLNPEKLGWPRIQIQIPEQINAPLGIPPINAVELRYKDSVREWSRINFPEGAAVGAVVKGDEIQLLPQTIRGNGIHGPQVLETLTKGYRAPDSGVGYQAVASALNASQLQPPVEVFSAWTDLVPVLGAIFSLTKPRRFVELGVHNGMSFFSACQLAEQFNLDTECIGIDGWEGDPHAGMHEATVFTEFSKQLEIRYPEQLYLRSFFDEAACVFESNSIDLIHIDGFHSYEAVRHDFQTWLPKMSDRAIMIFHDTNVHERDFGVWRFWEEVSSDYPHLEMYHGHGLGILYVGDEKSDVAEIFSYLSENPDIARSAKQYFEFQVFSKKLSKDLRKKHGGDSGTLDQNEKGLVAFSGDKWWHRNRHFRRWSNSIRKMRGRPKKYWPESRQ